MLTELLYCIWKSFYYVTSYPSSFSFSDSNISVYLCCESLEQLYHINIRWERHTKTKRTAQHIILFKTMLIDNVQNERVAIIKDDVRRGLGMLPKRAIFEKSSKGDFSKISKPVQVYTACQFVKVQNIVLCHFCFRKISPSHLWPICPQAEILFLLFWTCAWLGYMWFWKILRLDLFQIWEQVYY